MKATPTIWEAIQIEGLPDWYVEITPAEFWTRGAFDLFQAAEQAGLIRFDSDYSFSWTAGANMSKAALAYFCKRASRQLRLNRGSHTNWQPFEIMFNPQGNPLRLNLHTLDYSGQEIKKDQIDRFFDSYEPRDNTKTR